MDYIFLIITVVMETTAFIFMKLSDGFQNKLIQGRRYFLRGSFIFLTPALKQLPAGIANATGRRQYGIGCGYRYLFIYEN
ncbi:MAG TPA: SMR family transporter [Parafilimonas sp.]|nr:SMR family transporter [Parafilimonas sp.]